MTWQLSYIYKLGIVNDFYLWISRSMHGLAKMFFSEPHTHKENLVHEGYLKTMWIIKKQMGFFKFCRDNDGLLKIQMDF